MLSIVSAYYGNVNKMVDVTTQVQNLLAAYDSGKANFPIYIWPSTFNIPDPDEYVIKGLTVTYKYGNKPDPQLMTQSGVDGETLQLSMLPDMSSLVVNRATYGANGVAIDITETTQFAMTYFNMWMPEIGSPAFVNAFCGGRTIEKGSEKGVFFIDFNTTIGNAKGTGVDGQTLNMNVLGGE